MYVNTEHFLSPTATLDFEGPVNAKGDVYIRIVDGNFSVSAYMSSKEAKELLDKFDTLTSHHYLTFGTLCLFDKFGQTLLFDLNKKLVNLYVAK